MNKRLLTVGLIGAMFLAVGGCAKKAEPVAARPEAPKITTVPLVKAPERSQHFMAVNRQLELGGTLYGYVDVDGDMAKLAKSLNDVLGQVAAAQPAAAPFLKQDYAALFATLGFTDVVAAGFSSVPDETGYFRNRTFFYIPGTRHGLLAGLGRAPGPFVRLGLAPADTDAYFESEIDLPSMYATIKEVVTKVGGAEVSASFEAKLKQTSDATAFSLYNFINGLKGRVAMVVRLDGERELRLPAKGNQGLVLPAISLLICVDGVAASVEPTLAKSPQFKMRQEGELKLYEFGPPLPLQGVRPIFAIDGNTLYLATSLEYLKECRSAGPTGLGAQPMFLEALKQVGPEGNGLGYVSPHFFQSLRKLETLNPKMPEQQKQLLGMVLRSMPETDRPLVTVRRNLPDGILVQSYWNRSLKQDVATLAVYNPVTIGMMAAMAIPAFQKVRTASQEKAVLNNLRQLSAAADQYYLEHGVESATFDALVGPKAYIKRIMPVDGEDYRTITFKQGKPLQVMVPSLRKIVKYGP